MAPVFLSKVRSLRRSRMTGSSVRKTTIPDRPSLTYASPVELAQSLPYIWRRVHHWRPSHFQSYSPGQYTAKMVWACHSTVSFIFILELAAEETHRDAFFVIRIYICFPSSKERSCNEHRFRKYIISAGFHCHPSSPPCIISYPPDWA
jgi:hypothetical protein